MSNSIRPKGKLLRTFKLEEDDSGELYLTFTPQELKILGVKEGDLVDFKIVNGQIEIKKVPKAKESKKKRPTPKKKK
jgi:formylmethanofuran dehydrogenase subunit D